MAILFAFALGGFMLGYITRYLEQCKGEVTTPPCPYCSHIRSRLRDRLESEVRGDASLKEEK